jgi:hypothetical protein
MKTKNAAVNVPRRFSLRLLPAVALAALIAWCPIQTRANTIALSFTSHNNNLVPGNETVGWSFSLSSAVLVTDLGVWDGNFTDFGTGVGDGLAESHQVTIWDATTMMQLAQATVPAGTGATLSNGFRYAMLGSSVLLGPGNYVIGALYPTQGADPVANGAAGITTAAGVSYTGGRVGIGNVFPSTAPTFNAGLFGPNFQFTAPPTNGVPDSGSTWTLLLLGVTATFGLKSFVRRSA